MDLFRCLLFVARNFIQFPFCIGARIGRGVTYAHGLHAIHSSVLVWYVVSTPENYNIVYVPAHKTLKLSSLFAGPLNDTVWI